MPTHHAFEIDSTVGRYWLANGSGFELVERGGRKLGVVEDVVVDPTTQRSTRWSSSGALRSDARMCRPEDLAAVVPAAKLFVVAPGSSDALTHRTGRAVASLRRPSCSASGLQPPPFWRPPVATRRLAAPASVRRARTGLRHGERSSWRRGGAGRRPPSTRATVGAAAAARAAAASTRALGQVVVGRRVGRRRRRAGAARAHVRQRLTARTGRRATRRTR